MKEDLIREIELPEGIQASFNDTLLTIKGPKGEVIRSFVHPKINIDVEGNKIILKSLKATRREKSNLATFQAHIKNSVQGVQEPHVYKLKICSGHFPMNVSVSGQEFTVKNFLGESVPRKVTLPQGVKVKVEGTEIKIESPDKELAGLSAAKIEILCKIKKKDIRIFQDGCYLVHKAGKDIV
jgi:large subunit ribosomal protein L6